MVYEKPDSPFSPGRPVSVEFFVGRKKQVEEIGNYISSSLGKRQLESVLIYGDRGIGKSSLASYVSAIVERKDNMIPVHISLAGSSKIGDVVKDIVVRILEEIGKSNWFDSVKDFFGKYIKKIGFWGVQVELNIDKKGLRSSVNNFDITLSNIVSQIEKAGKTGLLIILDDINGLTGNRQFADWYKGFSDGVAVRGIKLPVTFMLLSTSSQRERLCALQPSLMRIFRPIKIEHLANDEVKDFFLKTFHSVGMKVSNNGLEQMVKYSTGLPIIMQEIGDSIFWLDEDGVIDERDVLMGVFDAADRVGNKYLSPTVYRALRSENYRSILRKLGNILIELPEPSQFKKSSIEKELNEPEKKVFNNFLQRLKKLKIIESEPEAGRGVYKFVNELFPIYIWMEAQTHGKKLKRV